LTRQKLQLEAELRNLTGGSMGGSSSRDSFFPPPRYNRLTTLQFLLKLISQGRGLESMESMFLVSRTKIAVLVPGFLKSPTQWVLLGFGLY